MMIKKIVDTLVSTHSRPKAAGSISKTKQRMGNSFNTQPPEGGWTNIDKLKQRFPEVSTHSRPKAAGLYLIIDKHL